jgi:hypothetical protein
MKKACLVVSPPYHQGAIFSRSATELNRDNCLYFYHQLQDIFLAHGISLNTHDINFPESCDFVIYNEMPSSLPKTKDIAKSFLLLFESELIRPDNWNILNHKYFSKIFTWHDDFLDNKLYSKINFTHDGIVKFLPFRERTKLCTLISGNKKVSHPLELYSHRIKAIRWFEENHPDNFEFYGAGWDLFNFRGPKIVRALNRLSFLRIIRKRLADKFPSYRGKVNNKLSTLKYYKFSICYENAQGIPGYITEKIFDSLAAGCIPVYWGAPNIADYIPEQCYIDKRKFDSYEDLYRYLITMSESEYNERLESITLYLNSAAHEKFTPSYNAKSVADSILLKR